MKKIVLLLLLLTFVFATVDGCSLDVKNCSGIGAGHPVKVMDKDSLLISEKFGVGGINMNISQLQEVYLGRWYKCRNGNLVGPCSHNGYKYNFFIDKMVKF